MILRIFLNTQLTEGLQWQTLPKKIKKLHRNSFQKDKSFENELGLNPNVD